MSFIVANSPTYPAWLLTFGFLQTISAAIIIYVNIFNTEQPLSSAGPPGLILRNGHFVVRPKAQYPPGFMRAGTACNILPTNVFQAI